MLDEILAVKARKEGKEYSLRKQKAAQTTPKVACPPRNLRFLP